MVGQSPDGERSPPPKLNSAFPSYDRLCGRPLGVSSAVQSERAAAACFAAKRAVGPKALRSKAARQHCTFHKLAFREVATPTKSAVGWWTA